MTIEIMSSVLIRCNLFNNWLNSFQFTVAVNHKYKETDNPVILYVFYTGLPLETIKGTDSIFFLTFRVLYNC